MIFAQKYFVKLKAYVAHKKGTRPSQQLAKRQFFNKRARKCLNALIEFSKASSQEKRIVQRVEKIHRHGLKQHHFRIMRRLFYLSYNASRLHERHTRARVITGLRHRLQYKRLRQQLIDMAHDKYIKSLMQKGFFGVRKHRVKQLELRAIVLGYENGHQAVLMGRAFRALKASANARKTKRMQLKYVDRLNNDALVGKCFNNLLYFAQRSRRTRSAYNEVTKYRSQKIRRQCLLTMLIVFNKQRLLRQLFEEVEEKHRNRMARAAFMRWLSRRQKLMEGERVLKEVRQLTMKHDLFKLWRCKYLMGSQVKQGLSDFCRQRKNKLLRNSFRGLRDELKATAHRKEMKKLCSFIFLKNLLKKCYGALGYNRFYQK